jgi:hypothetical protein
MDIILEESKMNIKEDGISCTSGNGAPGTVSGAAPENVISVVSLHKRLESASRRWSGTSLQERTRAASDRWLNEASWASRITPSDGADVTDYEKERTKTIKKQIADHEKAFDDARASRQGIDADLRDGDYLDDQIDDFLRDALV